MIPVIINNRNLLTWPKKMIEYISNFDMVGEIIILDNNSTYEPLLEWYNETDIRVVRTENLGHHAPWISGLVNSLEVDYYVVTDPDLDLSITPTDCLTKSMSILQKFPDYRKVGLTLDFHDVPIDSPYYDHIQSYEKSRQTESTEIEGCLINVLVDTTFAVYNVKDAFIGGVSLADYRSKHIPWYFTPEERDLDMEFKYYLDNASVSCSYKSFLNL